MVAVVGDHLIQRPSGGFIGVDVFFVISGFLITGLLIREVDRTGRVDLRDFYRRRIKRTVPLAAAVITATLIFGGLVFPAYRATQMQTAAKSAATFSINWQLIGQGTDYLHATDLPTPFQHFWSLAVEEQFYLLWPMVLVVCLLIAKRTLPGASTRGLVAVLAGVLTAASLSWCVWQTMTSPTAAYFSTASRGWEIGIGALLATSGPLLRRVPRSWSPALGWIGLIALGAAFFKIGPDSAFPAPWAALPVLATAAIIVASESSDETQLYPLTNRASQYVGDLSYSIYLWHYPVVIFGAALLAPSTAMHVALLVVIASLSVLSFHLIETPLRTASWRLLILRRRPSARNGRRIPVRVLVGALAALVVSSAILPGFLASSPAQAAPMGDLSSNAGSSSVSAAGRRAIDRAADANTWPSSVSTIVRDQVQLLPAEWVSKGCLWLHTTKESPESIADRCTFGSPTAEHEAVLFGDSIALSYYPALRRALASSHWRITIMTAEQCPAFAMTVGLDDGSPYPQCDQYRAAALESIRARHPDLVVIGSSYSAIWRFKGDGDVTDGRVAWKHGARSTITGLAKSTKRILVLDAPEMGPALRDCLTPIAAPRLCAGAVTPTYVAAAAAEHDALESLGPVASQVIHPSTFAWYCTVSGVCPSFVGEHPTLADGMHPSTTDARRISAFIAKALGTS